MGRTKARGTTRITAISKISAKVTHGPTALVIIYGIDLGKQFRLTEQQYTIGRSSKSSIVLEQDEVSRIHATVVREADGYIVRDNGSTNGTFVNDEAVKERLLKDGDLIKIGRTIFKYLAGGNLEAQYHEEIYRMTTTDGLTQIYNARFFREALEREVDRAQRYERKLSLALLDLDHFKQVNDQFGHLAGDYVLHECALLMRPNVRRHDVLARYGGDEFALILPEIEHDDAETVIDKLRNLINSHHFEFDGALLPVALSAGVASLRRDIKDATQLFEEADDRLYHAKASGRNRTSG
jgi:diguanylate cyclase (GGDEF)-like protein